MTDREVIDQLNKEVDLLNEQFEERISIEKALKEYIKLQEKKLFAYESKYGDIEPMEVG